MADDLLLPAADRDRLRRLRDAFDAVGFTYGNLLERLGETEALSVRFNRRQVPRLARRLGDDALGTLARLFLLGVPQPADALGAAAAGAVEVGLARRDGGDLVPLLKVLPFDELLLVIERPDRVLPPGLDPVMAVGSSTVSLAELTVRREAGSALDLGTGTGVHALLAAAHAGRVVATDANPRACRLATVNALFNRIDHVEVREGDWFAPVAGERFGLVVANPPFVMSPRVYATFRDSGRPADELCAELVRRAPQHLETGGFAEVQVQWAVHRGEDWRGRVGAWTVENGCDVCVLRYDTTDADAYAETWVPDALGDGPEYARQFDAWVDHFAASGIEAVGYGLVIMRKRADDRDGWLKFDDVPPREGGCGDSVLGWFARRDYLAATSDEALLGSKLAVPDGVAFAQDAVRAGGEWAARRGRLRRPTGLMWEVAADGGTVALLNACDGQRPLVEVLKELTGGTVPGGAAAVVRQLVERGLLLPVR
jgi:methylase of polypeptide subunit release factors